MIFVVQIVNCDGINLNLNEHNAIALKYSITYYIAILYPEADNISLNIDFNFVSFQRLFISPFIHFVRSYFSLRYILPNNGLIY